MKYSWDFPYLSQRMPVLAPNVVATSQPLAAQAGLPEKRRTGGGVLALLCYIIKAKYFFEFKKVVIPIEKMS